MKNEHYANQDLLLHRRVIIKTSYAILSIESSDISIIKKFILIIFLLIFINKMEEK